MKNKTLQSLSAAVGLSLLAISISTRAEAAGYDVKGLSDAQSGRVYQICERVLRVEPGSADYDACVSSLAATVRSENHADAMQTARANCRRRGYQADSADFAACTVQSMAADGQTQAAKVAAGSVVKRSSRPYEYASPREVFRRVQMACAELGLDPADGAFTTCTASLHAALFATDAPMD